MVEGLAVPVRQLTQFNVNSIACMSGKSIKRVGSLPDVVSNAVPVFFRSTHVGYACLYYLSGFLFRLPSRLGYF